VNQVWKKITFDLALVWIYRAFSSHDVGCAVCGQTMCTVYLHSEGLVILQVWSLIYLLFEV